MTSKDSLFARSYGGDTNEEVVVVGNRRNISHTVPEVIECEFVFRNGILIDAHVLRFKQRGATVPTFYGGNHEDYEN